MKRFSPLLLLIFFATVSARDNPWTANLYFENDLFSGTDSNYTNGVRMAWVSPDLSSYEKDESLPGWIRELNDNLHFFHDFREGLSRNLVVSFGQLIYTPEDRDTRELLREQRPYAGYLHGGVAYHTRSDSQLDTVEVNLGVVGPASYAEQAQDFIHSLRGIEKWHGWDNQIENEPTVQLLYEHKQVLFRQPLARTLQHDFINHAGVSLGNLATYANFGGEYRLGWDLPNDFGTSAVRPGGDNSAPGRGDPRLRRGRLPIFGLHGFVSVDMRLVAWDIFLDGNTFKDSHNVDKEPVVADISTGISFLTGRWKTSWAYVVRTREFEDQLHHQDYGSLSLSYTWY